MGEFRSKRMPVIVRQDEELLAAAYSGKIADFKRLIEQEDVGVNSKNESGMSALHMAIMGGNLNIAAYALTRCCDVNARDDEGRTALHLVCIDGDEEGFALLSARGADMAARTKEGKTPLHLACWFDHPEIVKFLLQAGADVNAQDGNGRTVLEDEEIDPEIKSILVAHSPSSSRPCVPAVTRPKQLATAGTTVTEGDFRTEGSAPESVVIEQPNQQPKQQREINWSTTTTVRSFAKESDASLQKSKPAGAPVISSSSMCAMAEMMMGGSRDMENSMMESMKLMSSSLSTLATSADENPLLKPLDPSLDCVRPWENASGAPVEISDAALDRMLAQMRSNVQ